MSDELRIAFTPGRPRYGSSDHPGHDLVPRMDILITMSAAMPETLRHPGITCHRLVISGCLSREATLLYGVGLRSLECCRLRIKGVDLLKRPVADPP